MKVVRASVLATVIVAAYGCGADEVAAPQKATVNAPNVGLPTGTTPTPISSPSQGAAGSGVSAAMPPPTTGTNQPTTPPPAGGTSTPARPATTPMPTPPTMTTAPAGMPAAPAMPQMPTAAGAMDPVIPAVTAECPPFMNSTVTFMGVSGIQIVAGPKASSPSAPMVFYWHGTGSFAAEFGSMAAAVQQGVVQEGGVLVSFASSSGMGDSSCSGTFIFSLGDMDIADQFLACAVKNHNIDPRRVFTTGCSAGGLFSACMASRRSNYVAASAPNSGGWAIPQTWQNMHTPALMTIHGAPGADVVIIDFSQSSATADMAFKQRGGFVINCNHGGGHCGGAGLAGDIWKFFKAHPFGVSPAPWMGGLPAGFSSQCKIF
jgi:predicted esterase